MATYHNTRMTFTHPKRETDMRALNRYTLWTLLLAGAMATVAFDFFGQSLSPMLGFASLAPVPLANNVIQTVFGAPYTPAAHLLHYIAGMIAYPAGWMFVAQPLVRRITPGLPWLAVAVIYGIGLWLFRFISWPA